MYQLKFMIAYATLMIFSLQTTFSQSVGIRAGVVYNHFMSAQQHTKGNPGFVAGINYSHSLIDNLEVSTGLEYLQLGGGLLTIEDNTRYGVDFDETPFPIKYRDSKVTIHTINLPVIANYAVYHADKIKISLGIGPEFAYNLQTTSNETVTGPINLPAGEIYGTYSQKNDETNNYQQFNFAGTLNLCIKFPVAGNSMYLDYRYRYSFMPVREGYSYLDIPNIDSSVNQGAFIMTIGYAINL